MPTASDASRSTRQMVALTVLAGVLLTAASASADQRSWTGLVDTNFQNYANWLPRSVPTTGDDVTIGDLQSNAVVLLTADTALLDDITLQSSSLLATDEYIFRADTILIGNSSTILLGQGGSGQQLLANAVTNWGSLLLSDSGASVGLIENRSAGLVQGTGVLRFGATNSAGTFDNQGTIRTNSGELVIRPYDTDDYVDLDGYFDSGGVEVNAGGASSLTIEAPIRDLRTGLSVFSGDITIGAEDRLTTHDAWFSSGVITMLGGPTRFPHQAATLDANLSLAGDLHVTGLATFEGTTVFRTTPQVHVADNSVLKLLGPTQYLGGQYEGEGIIDQIGPMQVGSPTTISVNRFDLDGNGDTQVTLLKSLTLDVEGIDISGANAFDGTLHVANHARLEVNTPDPWWVNGEVELFGDFAQVAGAPVTIAAPGNLKGVGQVTSLTNSGLVAPGGVSNTPVNTGTLQAASYTQSTSGNLSLDLMGVQTGEYDTLRVSGDVILEGALTIVLDNDFTPQLGDQFEILRSTGSVVVGAFQTENLPTLPGGLIFDVSYLPDRVQLSVVPTLACDFDASQTCDVADLNSMLIQGPVASGVPVMAGVTDIYDLDGDGWITNDDVDLWLAEAAAVNGFASSYLRGDANLDGAVNGADFIHWNSHKFTATLRWNLGDWTGDGVVNGQDFVVWNQNKFQSSDVTTVPEPRCGLWVLLIAFVFRCMRSVRRPPGR